MVRLGKCVISGTRKNGIIAVRDIGKGETHVMVMRKRNMTVLVGNRSVIANCQKSVKALSRSACQLVAGVARKYFFTIVLWYYLIPLPL